MKYVCDVCGWESTQKSRAIQRVELHLARNGRMFRKTLNVLCVL